MSTLVGRIHVRQEVPCLLSRCIVDRPGDFRGILHRQGKTEEVNYGTDDRNFFYDLPPWVSLARCWDDLDRFIREYNDHLLGPTSTNVNRAYVIQKIVSKVTDDSGDQYRVQWLNFSDAQSTLVTKEALRQEVRNSNQFFANVDESLEAGNPVDVNISMTEPPSSWKWRCSWLHLMAPRGVCGFENKHLKLSDRSSYFVHTVIGLGVASTREDESDDLGVEGPEATRQDYNSATDHNSGHPRCISYGLHSLLDGGRIPRVLQVPRMPPKYEQVTETKQPNSGQEDNPYEILLCTSGEFFDGYGDLYTN